jgi:hypothetical protein
MLTARELVGTNVEKFINFAALSIFQTRSSVSSAWLQKKTE